MISRITAILRSDAAAAAGAPAVRSVGRMVAMIVLARQAGIDGLAAFTLCVAAEGIVISALNAVFASPPAILCPGRRVRLRQAIHVFAERAQLYAGLIVGVVAGVLLAVTDLDVAATLAGPFAAYLAVAAAYQAKRATRISEFRSRPILAAEVLIAVAAAAAPLAARPLGLEVLAAFWWGQVFVQALVTLGLTFDGRRMRQVERPSSRVRRVVRAQVLRTGRRLFSGSIAASLSGRMQPFIIGVMLGPAAVGIYGVASSLAAPIRLTAGAARAALLPRVAVRRRRTTILPPVGRVMTIGGIAAVVSVAGLLAIQLAAPTIVAVAFGVAFLEAAPLVAPMVIYACFAALSSLLSTVRQGQGDARACANIRWLAAAVSPVVLTIGAVLLGLPGVIAALVGVEGGVAILLVRRGRPTSDPAASPAKPPYATC